MPFTKGHTYNKGKHWKWSEERRIEFSKIQSGRVLTHNGNCPCFRCKKQINEAHWNWKGGITKREVGVKTCKVCLKETTSARFLYCGDCSHRECLFCKKRFKIKVSLGDRGKFCSKNCSSKMHPWYKGGITEVNKAIRMSAKYKNWRSKVYRRDSFKCVQCGSKENLNADHIKPFSLYPDLRFKLSNGRTLCVDCHKKTDTFGWKLHNKKSGNMVVFCEEVRSVPRSGGCGASELDNG